MTQPGREADVRGIDLARHAMYRAVILAAAEGEFSSCGFAEAKMTSIARAAEVSLATVYKTFAGKAEVWEALHADRMRELLTFVEATTRGLASPRERLLRGVEAVAVFLAEHPLYLELNLKEGFGWGASDVDGVVGGNQRTAWSAGLDMITRGVSDAISAGELRDLRPRVAAGMIISGLQVWLYDWMRAGQDRPPAELAAELATFLERMLAGG